ncbi:hypothetical protein C1645_882788 [Glomus cerebriforme]|uniref:G-protein coupled receptors family 1 profile domain-containing protein n=1 Tax=Glomus cerebriforme TaxID=658196 RepID=A0A397S5B9_9GLOM|nr:hypothetical protein C1645_882791 [Glomus cerebriforme]RIA79195.1 hypothetical protein C1645_882788 [Glomus cerebriforme]
MSSPDCSGTLSYTKLLCRVNDSHLWIYYITIIICIIVSLFAFSVLLYKYFHDNSPLWGDHLFEPITGFLFWVSLHSSIRAADLGIIALDLMPNGEILESFINYVGWTCGQFAIATYIVGTFKAIPRLAFHRPTGNRHDSKCKLTQFIPGQRSVLLIYWSYIIGVGVIVTIFSCLKGYYVQIGNQTMYKFSQGVLLFTLSIANFACILGLLKYGRLLVVLTTESVRLVSGVKNKDQHNAHKAHLKKLKIINFALLVIVSWSSLICLLWAVVILAATKQSSLPLFTMILSFTTHIGFAIMNMAAILAIIHGESVPKYMGNTEIVSFATTISRNNSVRSASIHNQNSNEDYES